MSSPLDEYFERIEWDAQTVDAHIPQNGKEKTFCQTENWKRPEEKENHKYIATHVKVYVHLIQDNPSVIPEIPVEVIVSNCVSHCKLIRMIIKCDTDELPQFIWDGHNIDVVNRTAVYATIQRIVLTHLGLMTNP